MDIKVANEEASTIISPTSIQEQFCDFYQICKISVIRFECASSNNHTRLKTDSKILEISFHGNIPQEEGNEKHFFVCKKKNTFFYFT